MTMTIEYKNILKKAAATEFSLNTTIICLRKNEKSFNKRIDHLSKENNNLIIENSNLVVTNRKLLKEIQEIQEIHSRYEILDL